MTVCPNCQSVNQDDARFCASCGSQLKAAPEVAGHAALGGGTPPPTDPSAQAGDLNRRAMQAIARSELPEALELVNRALVADANHVPSLRTRVDILRRIGLTTQAEVEAQKITVLEKGGRPYAGFWQRFGAQFLDGIISFLLSLIPGVIAGVIIYFLVVPDNPTEAEEEDALTIAAYGWYAVAGVTGFLYVWIGNAYGGTWGKRAFGLKVVSVYDGKSIGLSRSFVRYLVALVGAGVVYLGWLWMLWDKQKQTWHDKAAGSIVVKA